MEKTDNKKTEKGKTTMKDKSIYEKLQNTRIEVQNSGIKKGGRNKYSNYDYFELPDFLPQANEAFNKNRITGVFNLYKNLGVANLVIHDWDSDNTITFQTPIADATTLNKQGLPSNLEIQTLGSQHTYLKRYLYMNALELAEHDGIERNTNNPEFKPKDHMMQELPPREPKQEIEYATKEQIAELIELFVPERIEKMLELFKVDKLQDMPKAEVDVIIKREKLSKSKKENKIEITSEKVASLDDLE